MSLTSLWPLLGPSCVETPSNSGCLTEMKRITLPCFWFVAKAAGDPSLQPLEAAMAGEDKMRSPAEVFWRLPMAFFSFFLFASHLCRCHLGVMAGYGSSSFVG